MRRAFTLLLGSLLLSASPAQAASNPQAGEAKLARALEGRVAGEPVDCVNLSQIRSSRIINGEAILYETAGGTVYVNRPEGRESLNDWDLLFTKPFMNRLCSIDTVEIYDSGARMWKGVVFLNEFVPYRKAR